MTDRYLENIGPSDVLTSENAALLLIDHQVGLMQLIRDMTPEEFKNNILGLAKTAKHFKLPVILTTSRDYGPNAPILPELKQIFPDVTVIRRTGVINAWRWPAFRRAVEETGRKKLIIAGISDGTCLQFPSLDAVKEGFDVHAVIDASGAVSTHERDATIATLSQAGVKIRNWWSVGAELEADWRRDESQGWPYAMIFREHLVSWGNLLDTSGAYANNEMLPPKE
ncbi:isochorismatase family protein [Methanosphaerula palustris]|uniref:Isochorismatase hydrolase n=1 Tax=Methanosphaerula palustris (strain ATCC BAA-1556 / DSM 19958 / E1-9c) TaxID=521011 RepID=B8GGK4_METPE|nr:isochorismatase family protein [Methanosphaerula palustris]ACL16259.1 isochorismatase hydrolase [Methanosphaerula palustris E1-9c]